MSDPTKLTEKFWKALNSDRTLMLGLKTVEEGFMRPMTAQVENDQSPIWFFTSRKTDLAKALLQTNDQDATASFVSKGHDLFATIQGRLCIDNNRAVIDRLWNHFIAAWFEGGKDDPNLILLRLDTKQAEIWTDASSLVADIKMLLGVNPKQEYKDGVAKLAL